MEGKKSYIFIPMDKFSLVKDRQRIEGYKTSKDAGGHKSFEPFFVHQGRKVPEPTCKSSKLSREILQPMVGSPECQDA